MEESRGARLQRNLDALHGDLAFAQANKEQLEGVAKAAEQFIAEQHARMAQVCAGACIGWLQWGAHVGWRNEE